MPIDPMYLDPMLDPFRTMLNECKDKNLTGKHYDAMCQTMDRMEELAKQHSDVSAFSMQMLKEDLYLKFSEHYGKVLSSSATSSGGSDAALLKQSLDAYRDAIKRIKAGKEDALSRAKHDSSSDIDKQFDMAAKGFAKHLPKNIIESKRKEAHKQNKEELKKYKNKDDSSVEVDKLFDEDLYIKPIQDVITLGEESGMTFPRFLRLMIERGLDKALEGHVATYKGLKFFHLMAQMVQPESLSEELALKKLELFEGLEKKSPIKIPNSDEYRIEEERLERKYNPLILKEENIKERWNDVLGDLYLWSLSYCSFAPTIEPWRMSPNPRKAVIETQKINPGLIQEKLKLLKKYHDVGFYDIFTHSTFKLEVASNFMNDSQELIEFLIEKVYPHCKPSNDPPSDVIKIHEAIYKDKKEMNPDMYKYYENFVKCYDSFYGKGYYAAKFPMFEQPKTNAKPWEWNSFEKSVKKYSGA